MIDCPTRCSVCFRLFCCSAHRTEHQVKHHTEIFSKIKQDHLVKVFEKKAQTLLIKSQNRQETRSVVEERKNIIKTSSRVRNHLPAVKRLHSEMNKRIFTTSVTFLSETRKVLVPVHRLKPYSILKDERENCKDPVEEMKESSVDSNRSLVRTSTPITNSLSVQKTSQNVWNDISPASTISNFETPPDVTINKGFEEQVKLEAIKAQAVASPLRGIICKVSKYDVDTAGPSPLSFNTSRCRRVTFSFNSQSSLANSPLQSIEEVEGDVFKNEKDCIEEVQSASVSSYYGTDKPCTKDFTSVPTDFTYRVFEDSPSYNKETGFFSCVTNMFCSAVHTIPSLGSWRKADAERSLNGSKRTRTELEVFDGPVHKRPCYPCDMRRNPIRARKPISDSRVH